MDPAVCSKATRQRWDQLPAGRGDAETETERAEQEMGGRSYRNPINSSSECGAFTIEMSTPGFETR